MTTERFEQTNFGVRLRDVQLTRQNTAFDGTAPCGLMASTKVSELVV
jgi:hypothetical protein